MFNVTFKILGGVSLIASIVYGQTVQAANTPNAADILKRTVQNIYSRSEESTYVMRLIDNDGSEKTRKMHVFFRREKESEAKLTVKFMDPADIRGTGFLSVLEEGKPADQWLYIPSMKKLRRIRGGNESESFLGSDFTVGDLTSVDNDKERYDYSVTAENKKCGQDECYEVTGLPKSGIDPSGLPYSKRVLLVRKDNFVSTRIEFYNSTGQLQKVLELQNFHKDGAKNWVADRMEMSDLISRHKTIIEVSKRDTSAVPSNMVFTQTYMERD